MSSSIPSYITVVIAVFVASIGYRQWKTAHDRLKLDLFNKRFELYQAVMEMESILLQWREQGTEKHQQINEKFKRAVREARFLFPASSHVPRTFVALQNVAGEITSLWALLKYNEQLPEAERKNFENHRLNNFNQWVPLRFDLERWLTPFLQFDAAGESGLAWLRLRRGAHKNLAEPKYKSIFPYRGDTMTNG